MHPSAATAAPSHLCSPGMDGPYTSTIASAVGFTGEGSREVGCSGEGAPGGLGGGAEGEEPTEEEEAAAAADAAWKDFPRAIGGGTRGT